MYKAESSEHYHTPHITLDGVRLPMGAVADLLNEHVPQPIGRPAREWFMDVTDSDIRDRLIHNTTATKLIIRYTSLADAIYNSFDWYDTPEGHEYWSAYRAFVIASENV